LDIQGAFDNTSFNAMVGTSRGRGLEETSCRWIRSMLESRLVHAFLTGSSMAIRVAGGCPQGGMLSPLLWNLVDDLLACINDKGFCAMGYADDIVIIVQGKYTHIVRELMQAALNKVVKWTTKEGLSISPHKTVVVPFTNKRNIEGLGPLTLLGRQLQLLGGVKHLGVFLDSKLNWNQHVQNVIMKAQTTFAVVRRRCRIRWGLRPSMVHWLYTRVIRPSIFYEALVWWSKAMHKTTKILLSRIQRMTCLAIMGAMRSTPTAAMEVLLNLTPLELLIMVEARMAFYRLQNTKQLSAFEAEMGLLSIWKIVSDPILEMRADHKIPVFNHSRTFKVIIDWDYWRNVDPVVPEDSLIWFTDGSRMPLGTGSGIFGVRPNRSLKEKKRKKRKRMKRRKKRRKRKKKRKRRKKKKKKKKKRGGGRRRLHFVVCPNSPSTVTIPVTVRSQPYSEAEPKIVFHSLTNLVHFAGPPD
jgi:hypothetical protein